MTYEQGLTWKGMSLSAQIQKSVFRMTVIACIFTELIEITDMSPMGQHLPATDKIKRTKCAFYL